MRVSVQMKVNTQEAETISGLQNNHRAVVLATIFLTTIFCGCAPLQLPTSLFPDKKSDGFRRQGIATDIDPSMTEKIYYAVRQAKAENGVVLQVIGDASTVRVLPLPEGDRTVYVSELLTQTGVIEKLGHVDATLHRPSDESISGVPMEIKMGRSRDNVQPSSDYALQPGDRLTVRKATNPALELLFDGFLGK